jgi:F420H(2)-dependent quinone reductase
VNIGNTLVTAVLRSPLHRLASSRLVLVRYQGRRSGRTITTPTMYAAHDADVAILVGRPDRKTWWRNFAEEHPVDVLVAGRWLPMRAVVVRGTTDPDAARPLLEAYLGRFPSARRVLPGSTDGERLAGATLVWCRPR